MPSCGSVFSGAGLLDIGLHLAGFEHAWLCERDSFRRDLLRKRFPGAVVYDDIRTVRGPFAADATRRSEGRDSTNAARRLATEPQRSTRRVDLIAGGFPCKGASTAGKREGFEHAESVLWGEMRRVISEVRPRYVLVENVANLLSMAASPGKPAGSMWGTVVGDLAALGFGDIRWDCLPAAAVGAPHLRDRVFCVAVRTDDSDTSGAAEPAVRGGSARRRGVHLNGEAPSRPDVHDEGRDPHGGARSAGPQGDAGDLRRAPVAAPERNGGLARDLAMGSYEQGRRDALSLGCPAVPDREGGSGDAGAVVDDAVGRGGTQDERQRGLDAGDHRDGDEGPRRDEAVESSRAEFVHGEAGHDAADVATHADGADAERDAGERGQPDGRADAAGRVRADAADAASEGGQGTRPGRQALGGTEAGCGVAVDWGDYQPAITRWETIHGPAPEPLIRRLDDGDDKLSRLRSRVDRSRLSALGDGVHVYVGWLAGEHIMSLERCAGRVVDGPRSAA